MFTAKFCYQEMRRLLKMETQRNLFILDLHSIAFNFINTAPKLFERHVRRFVLYCTHRKRAQAGKRMVVKTVPTS